MTQTTVQIKNPAEPASEKQVHFLFEVLLVERDCPSVAEKARFAKTIGLTKGVASQLIGEALKAPKKAVKKSIDQQIIDHDAVLADYKAEQEAKAALPVVMPEFGYYDIDGTIYHWGVTAKDAYPTLRRLHVVTNYDGTKKGSWKKAYIKWDPTKQVETTWVQYDGKGYTKTPITKKITVPAQLVGKTPMTLDEAKAKGKAFTFCVKCGATLTDPVSVANGIGPVCIKAFA